MKFKWTLRAGSLLAALCFGLSQGAQAQQVPELLEPVSVQLDTFAACVDEISRISVVDASVVPYVEEMYFRQEGTVSQVHAVIGQQVKAGDLLITLNKDEETKELETLADEIETMEKKAVYSEQLSAIDLSILEVELDRLQNALALDETAIELKKLEIEEKKLNMEMEAALRALQLSGLRSKRAALEEKISQNALYAPFDGRIIHMADLSRGSYVSAYTPLVFLADDSRLSVQSAFISGNVLSSAYGITALIGAKQYAITPVEMDPEEYVPLALSGDTPTTEFMIQKPDEGVSPGMYAAVCIVKQHVEGALQVPSNALYQGSEGRYLYVVEDGARVRREVETGISNEIMTQITKGLEEGEIVYVKE